MNEKVYKTISGVGITNLVTGICLVILALGIGITMIVNGAKLIKSKSSIIF